MSDTLDHADQKPKTDPPEDIQRAVVNASASPAIQDIVSARLEQITRYGHTPDQDSIHPMHELASRSRDKIILACEDLSMGGWDILALARKRLVVAAALILAQIDRIDRKLAERESAEE